MNKLIWKKFLVCLFLVVITIPINKVTDINWSINKTFNSKMNMTKIRYCGKIHLYTFSITSSTTSYGAINLYYPTNIGDFWFEDTHMKILKVTPTYLKVDILNPRF